MPRAHGVDGALAPMDDGVLNPEESKRLSGLVDRVSFSDGAQVDLHAGPGEVDQVVLIVEENPISPDPLLILGQLFFRRNPLLAAEKAPRFRERACRNVECAS